MHQDCKVQIAVLITDKAFVTVLAKYSDFANDFSKKSATILLEYTKINIYFINLEKDKQLYYGPIYNLEPLKLETLKTNTKTNLTNSFIQSFKFLARAPILFDKKLNRTFSFISIIGASIKLSSKTGNYFYLLINF